MTNADRTLAALILALGLGAIAVRPVWRSIAPEAAAYADISSTLPGLTPLDPWGQPWDRSRPEFNGVIRIVTGGPDRRIGTSDDLLLSYSAQDGSRIYIGLRGETASRVWSYRSAPTVPIALAVILLLTRAMSHLVRRRTTLWGRAAVAFALAIVPAVLTILALVFNGAIEQVIRANPTGMASPGLGLIGTLYLLFVAAIFSHRELHEPPVPSAV